MGKVARGYIVIVIGLMLVSSVYGVSKRSFLWKVGSKGARVYILGSFHVGKKSMYPLQHKILKAFNESSILAMETSKSRSELTPFVMKYTLYPRGGTLKQSISRKTYMLVKKTANELGIPMVVLERFRPWFVAFTITYTRLAIDGFEGNYGIEEYFRLLNSKRKPVIGLEEVGKQLNIFNQFSPKLQEKFLYYTIKDLHLAKHSMKVLWDMWKVGDVNGFREFFFNNIRKYPVLAPIYKKLLDERNINMANKIKGFLKAKKVYFVIVGAGHIVGKKGIISLLLKEGYNIKQL